ncbi:MAG: nucleotidyltransferase domain-containing protein [Anaerolineae bacterium]|nr:nucleotidyltransferase domain-containing protein [Anaerolineae bacterium]
MIDQALIEHLVKTIATRLQPERIVLFGSWAWGEPDEHSDIDILVIKHSSLRRDKRAREVSDLFASRTFPLDVLVYTPAEVERLRKMRGSFVRFILENGRILYERPT